MILSYCVRMKLKFVTTGDPQRDADAVAKQIITSPAFGPAEAVYDLLSEYHETRLVGSKLRTARSVLVSLVKQDGCKGQTIWLITCFDLVLTWLYYRKGGKQ